MGAVARHEEGGVDLVLASLFRALVDDRGVEVRDGFFGVGRSGDGLLVHNLEPDGASGLLLELVHGGDDCEGRVRLLWRALARWQQGWALGEVAVRHLYGSYCR